MAIEYEAKFLDINKAEMIQKILDLSAENFGEDLMEEIIFVNDKIPEWKEKRKFVRLRKRGDVIHLTYKHKNSFSVDGTVEHEITVNDMDVACELLLALDLEIHRHQEKLRHTLKLPTVTFDIDTWPHIPTYLEIEGETEQDVRDYAKKLGLDWDTAVFDNAGKIARERYGIDWRGMNELKF